MRYFSLLLLLSLFIFSLPAHAQKATSQKTKPPKVSKKATPARTGAKAKPTTSPVLTFERTPCYGTCPAYTMKVYANGRVAYEGRHAVPLLGQHELKLPAAAVTGMLRQAKEAHFETFEKQYSRNTTDLPSTIVALRQPDGTLKTVMVEEGAPENVKDFFTFLGNQFDQLAQLNGVEK